MKLSLIPVTAENRDAAEKLAVCPEQKDFIEPVTECMQEADALSDWEPVCIMDGDTPVGFSMYGYMRMEKDPRLWFDRLLIDRRYQHRGYGRKTVEAMLKRMQTEFPGKDIYTSAYEDNLTAISLYRSFGFRINGERDINGERVMVLHPQEST